MSLLNRRILMMNNMEDEEVKEWTLIRSITIPEDIPEESDGINWVQKSNGGFLFGFETDENGNTFSLTELMIQYNTGYMSSDTVFGEPVIKTDTALVDYDIYNNNTLDLICGFGKNGSKVYGWTGVKCMGNAYMSFGGYNTGGAYSNVQALREIKKNNYLPISKVALVLKNTKDCGLLPGSTFEFYGR